MGSIHKINGGKMITRPNCHRRPPITRGPFQLYSLLLADYATLDLRATLDFSPTLDFRVKIALGSNSFSTKVVLSTSRKC